MRSSPALAFLLAATAGTVVHAQDFPPFPREHPDEDDQPGLWFQEPNVGYGPFHYVSLSLVPSLRSGFETNFPSSMASGRFDLRVTESWVKVLSSTNQWLLDYEVVRSNVGFSWALSDDVKFDLTIESASRTGGPLDSFILGFHQAVGLSTGRRNRHARDENRIEIQPPDGGARIVVDESDPQPFEQAAVVTLQDTVTYGDESLPALAWSLSVRGSLARSDVTRAGPFDFGASLGVVKEFDTLHVYAGGNFAWFGREEFFGLKLRTIQWSTTLAVEWHLAAEFSLIAQYVATSGGVDRFTEFSHPSHEIVAGFKWEPWRGVLIELAIVENIINPYNSPDFGVHGGATFRW